MTFRLRGRGSEEAKRVPGVRPGSSKRFVRFVRHSHPAATPAHLISFLLEQPTMLSTETDPGSGPRHERQGRKDSDRGVRFAR